MTVSQGFIAGLPDPDIVETLDVEAIITALRDDLVSRFPPIVGVIDLESEPARMILEVVAYREVLIRARVNDAARANLVAFATGTDLDHLAGFYDVVRLTNETDAALRSRVILAVAGRSPGGTEARYEYVARSADARVADCVVYRDDASPTVRIAITATDNGGVPDQDLLDAVTEAVSAPDVRLVSDTLIVEAATTQATNITVDVWLDPTADAAILDTLAAGLTAAWAAYGGIGRDLTTSWIVKTLMVPGVQRVDVIAPATHVDVPYNRAAALGTITINDRGRDY